MKGTLLGLAAVAGLALAGCDDVNISFGHDGGRWGAGTKGSGNATSETRDIKDFHELKVGGAFHVKLAVGPSPSFKIEGDDNILPLIKSEVKDGELHIYASKSINPKKDITVTLTSPKIDALDISGACELTGTGINAETLNLECSGASKVQLDGTGKELTVNFSGASEVKLNGLHANKVGGELSGASHLWANGTIGDVEIELSGASEADLLGAPSKKAKVSLSGASNMKLDASDGIEADLTGASNLRYKGNQNVHIDKNGSSNSEKIN